MPASAIAEAYAASLPPLFLALVPLAIAALVMILALERRPLVESHS
ncbi:hypothetical protein [Microbacterium esteraromaticum]|nr:hypothetical protein [Microbacterium esteraromaticum]